MLGGGGSSVVGSAMGLLLGGPEGAFAGGVTGTGVTIAVRHIGHEMSARLLSPREQQRVGMVFTLAAAEIVDRIGSGEQIREDGFFSGETPGRSDGEEVWESVLLKSQREPEEKKLPYMAYLLANLAFDADFGVHLAHQITKTAEQLSYRQLCILKLSVVKERYRLRTASYIGQEEFEKELLQLLYEYMDLYNRSYLNFGETLAAALDDVNPGRATVQGLGADTFNLMRLREIPDIELVPIADRLR